MTVKTIPTGYHTVTPYLIVRDVPRLIKFMEQAFEAKETYRGTGSAGGIHAEVRVGDSMVMIGGKDSTTPEPATLYLYLDDVDATYRRALQAGATSVSEPADQPFGDRIAGVKDPSGVTWYLATHIKDVPLT